MHVCKLFSLHYLSPKNFLVIPFPTMSLNLPFTLIKVNYAFHIWCTLSILQIWSSGLVYICNDLPTSSEDTKLIHPTQLCHTCHLVHKVYMILLSLKWHYKGQNGNPLQCSCLRIPGTVEPDGLPSMGLHRVRHDWSDLAVAAAASYRAEKLEVSRETNAKEICGQSSRKGERYAEKLSQMSALASPWVFVKDYVSHA